MKKTPSMTRRRRVALLAEGVDRNLGLFLRPGGGRRSPSSRRAWIEIARWRFVHSSKNVALLAEGVDRNSCIRSGSDVGRLSPSSRRAWIEMR